MFIGDESKSGESLEAAAKDRRKFLTLIPLAVFGAIAASLGVASKKFLAPSAAAKEAGETVAENWKTLGAVADLGGEEPIEKIISVEKNAGWSKTIEDTTVFVLPKHDNKVLSSVCPHEGCPVVWDRETKNFLCPCHDSFFSDSGKKLSGPSTKDLTALETCVEDGKLKVKI